ncbi:hypothetical protein MAHJHV35_47660 [Mycobacterium avium subsp. hominissuis]
MARVSHDENLHMIFYRDVSAAFSICATFNGMEYLCLAVSPKSFLP